MRLSACAVSPTQGKLGELERTYPDDIVLMQEGEEIKVTKRVETRKSRQLHGKSSLGDDKSSLGR